LKTNKENKMTFDQVKSEYLNENFEYALATQEQVDKLSEWLDDNDYHNAAQQRWDEYQEELDSLRSEFY
jgi:hypothetical protein